ncbi:unnamed protein product, partial [Caretta caretta]
HSGKNSTLFTGSNHLIWVGVTKVRPQPHGRGIKDQILLPS